MKTLATVIVSTLVSLSAMGMGYPTSNSPKTAKQPAVTADKQRYQVAPPMVSPDDVQLSDDSRQPKTTVNAITDVIVRLFDLSGRVVGERNVDKKELLSGTTPQFLSGSHFVTLTEGVAYYFIERKED